MRIWNFTPHAINIVENCEYDVKKRKYMYKGAEGKYIIKNALSSDGVLNAKIGADPNPTAVINGVPVYTKYVKGIDEIPSDVADDDFVIVSALYASAYEKINCVKDMRLYTVSDPVYVEDTDGSFKIVGCRGICPAF